METNNIDAVAFEYLKGTNACKYVKKQVAIRGLAGIIISSLLLLSGVVAMYKNWNELDIKSFALLALFIIVPLAFLIPLVLSIINLIRVKDPLYVKFATIENVHAKGEDKSYSGTNGHKRVTRETIEFYADCKEDNGKMHEYCALAERGFKCHNHIEVSACERSMMKNMEEFVGKTKDLYKGDKVIVFKFDTKEKGKYEMFGGYFIKYKA